MGATTSPTVTIFYDLRSLEWLKRQKDNREDPVGMHPAAQRAVAASIGILIQTTHRLSKI